MHGQKKAAPPAGTGMTAARGANNDESTGRTISIPHDAHQRKPSDITCQIVKARLPHGRDNAKKSVDLIAETGLENRVFRKAVELLRLAGEPVISGDHGYFLVDLATPDGQREAARFLRQEGHRIRAIAKRLEPLKRSVAAAQEVGGGQIQVEGW